MRSALLNSVAVLCLCLGLAISALGLSRNSLPKTNHTAVKTMHAVGTFDAKVTPVADGNAGDPSIGRMLIDKEFHGGLEGSSKGEMLAFGTGAKGSSGGYVAIERVQGSLNGHSGTFVLQHSGSMKRGEPSLSVTVVPDSGTGDLVGLAGTMKIDFVNGVHHYEFSYSLDDR